MNILKKIGNALLDILIVLILVASVATLALSLTSKASGVGSIGGYTFLSVQTDSMEPTIMVGDLAISKLATEDEYEIGDIVTFRMIVDGQSIINTHRIVEKSLVDGSYYYTTQGDNAAGADSQRIIAGDIIAVYTGIKLSKMGTVLDFLQSKVGFFLCILLPMIVLFAVQLFKFIKSLIEYNAEKAKEEAKNAASELTEEQKQKAIEEYLKAQSEAKKASAEGGEKGEE